MKIRNKQKFIKKKDFDILSMTWGFVDQLCKPLLQLHM